MIHRRSLHLHQCTFPVGGITFNLGCAQRLPPSVFLIPCSPDIFLLIYLRHSLPPLSPRSTRYEPSSHESSPTIRSLKESKMSRVGDLSSASGSGYQGITKMIQGGFLVCYHQVVLLVLDSPEAQVDCLSRMSWMILTSQVEYVFCYDYFGI
ncbi:hypothetical protein HanPSC8_Chr03g0089591 [Helianthus annuus]|nr:hypothetical protein HanIR_Chr03g0101701 [Helianthus annuus]KAJ0942236.1 hypothetical protein HanPSC8_Chr03g0089591 [Helianthus annuus]